MPELGYWDVAVVGGGPAGLAAATALREQGVRDVVVLERDAEAGGVPRHCGHYPFGMREFRRLLKGPQLAQRLVFQALEAGVRIITGASVMALEAGPSLLVSTDAGVQRLDARRILLATGVRETPRSARLIGGTKPGGVITTGALQGMVYLAGRRPFRRPVVLGTELVSYSALLTCRGAGIRPRAMIEEGARPTAWQAANLLPRALGVETLFSTRVVAIHGREQVTGIDLLTPDGPRHLETDGVIVSGRFQPEASLLRDSHLLLDPGTGGPRVDQFGRCSDPDYFAAGNLLRPVETAGWCWSEGRRVAAALARDLHETLPIGSAMNLQLDPALRYVLPQRIEPVAEGGLAGALEHLQLRVATPLKGRLRVMHEDRCLWQGRLNALPERRVLIPIAPLSALPPGAQVAIRLEPER
ncbi:NAD(P)/FAD-dependent oxidoreductase [Stutzerimonas azotifigens]|uniref:NAD(P)/FAD-dependent oxidoreductase n=1 Tax=Stutzerimonas azotifigens TaxID=291995 RepID=UPI0004150A25|nr:FAD-dependent oxidoreductase [Stutzerimonas azotifigens]